ncbi:MAG TPA: hypothetical protein VJA21_33915 [Verrucomicrobiae bacterium]
MILTLWLALAGGVVPQPGQAANPPASAGQMSSSAESKYQEAMRQAREAQDAHFTVTALKYAQDALKIKPGDEAATNLQNELQAEIASRLGQARPPATVPAPPKVEPKVEPPPVAAAGKEPASAVPELGALPAMPEAPKATKHEVSVSGDFLLGEGNVTMPFGFSLAEDPFLGPNVTKSVAKPDRSSTYYGGTVSYSYGQAWYLDLGYIHGSSSGDTDVALGGTELLPSSFKIDDDWYQVYVRYAFPKLRGKRFSAYLRAGMSYVDAELQDETTIPVLGLYRQTDKTTDLLGNVGFGVGYLLHRSKNGRFWTFLQAEGEGFYGNRSQDSKEALVNAGFDFPTAKIDNDLYGGIGRGTVRLEYRLGRSGLLKIFGDGGIQAKFTEINYPSLGTFNELLWGPYVKVGLRYAF